MAFSYNVRSDKDTHFTGAIAQNAGEDESLSLSACLAGVNGKADGSIKAITLVSDQNLAWEVQVWSSATHGVADVDTDKWIGRWAFAEADGLQLAGTGSFRYFIDGLDIPVADGDLTGKMHLTLTNRSATAKNAGATGEVIVDIEMEPTSYD